MRSSWWLIEKSREDPAYGDTRWVEPYSSISCFTNWYIANYNEVILLPPNCVPPLTCQNPQLSLNPNFRTFTKYRTKLLSCYDSSQWQHCPLPDSSVMLSLYSADRPGLVATMGSFSAMTMVGQRVWSSNKHPNNSLFPSKRKEAGWYFGYIEPFF